MLNQHKGTRKEIREDKLLEFSLKAWNFAKEFQKNIAIAVAVIAIAVVAYILYSSNQSKNNEAASFDLSQVMPVYDMGAFQEAIDGKAGTKIKGLKKIVDEYGSTDYGQVAKIFLGHSYYNLKKFDEALKAYEDFGGSNDFLAATAYAGQAACYEAKKDAEKAADLYVKASKVDENNTLNPQYLLNAGINYIELNKTEEAKELFLKIKRDYPKSAFTQSVDRYLVQVE